MCWLQSIESNFLNRKRWPYQGNSPPHQGNSPLYSPKIYYQSVPCVCSQNQNPLENCLEARNSQVGEKKKHLGLFEVEVDGSMGLAPSQPVDGNDGRWHVLFTEIPARGKESSHSSWVIVNRRFWIYVFYWCVIDISTKLYLNRLKSLEFCSVRILLCKLNCL